MVDVIIPTYNRAHVLGQAVRSVLNQAYQNFELIVIRDGPTDGRVQRLGYSQTRYGGEP